jgi:hypothetical protein
VVPYVLFFAIRYLSSESLSSVDLNALTAFARIAILLGTAVTIAIYLWGCYPKGSRSRLFFGLLSATLIVVYSITALGLSGLNPLLSDSGIRIDMKYVALIVAYAAVPLMFEAIVEFAVSRRSWLESTESASAKKRTVRDA